MPAIRPLAARIRALFTPQCRYLLTINAIPLLGILGFAVYSEIFRGTFFPLTILEPLPMTLAFSLWIRLLRPTPDATPFFSLRLCAVSIACFILAPFLSIEDREIAMFIGTFSGLFVYVPVKTGLKLATKHVKITLMSCYLGLALYIHLFLSGLLWKAMCQISAVIVQAMMSLIGIESGTTLAPAGDSSVITIHTSQFSVSLFPGCSGMEGISLFLFLLFFMMLLDWPLFKKMPLSLLMGSGMVYMFFLNSVRIFTLIMMGHWTFAFDAGDFARSMRGMALFLFHSMVGFTFYLAAFWLFAHYIYKIARRREARNEQ